MMALRLLDAKGVAALGVAALLGGLLLLARHDARKWHRSSDRFEQLYRAEQAVRATEVQAVRIASAEAAVADAANARRVITLQQQINRRSDDDVQIRLADARARFKRLRQPDFAAAATASGRADTPVSGLPASSPDATQAADENRLPGPDALIATEQAIQLDELIKWVRAQGAIEPDTHQH